MKTPDTPKEASSAPDKRDFTGTDNPRHLRVIRALMTSPRPREEVDQIAGASNSPELVAELRRRGLEVPCLRKHTLNRDGVVAAPGIYFFTQDDRQKINDWRLRRGGAI